MFDEPDPPFPVCCWVDVVVVFVVPSSPCCAVVSGGRARGLRSSFELERLGCVRACVRMYGCPLGEFSTECADGIVL